ncbi:MAG TPA: tRNA lysidine(34) synthetase TilS [Rariglobus sp.]|jgi:tRNA(Ile)-lysidine synthase|nr:tRNA lysidine(34) synthetase TilS [Rariglobus sp.]
MSRNAKTPWTKVAAQLALTIPVGRFYPAVTGWVDGFGRTANPRWAVAFSGGADSLALLLLLWAHWPERRSKLVALHFNHRLRGRASATDAVFCRRVCAALGVTFLSAEWKQARKGASEAEAREARFAFFRQVLARRRIKALWLGHQQDDIAETALMRLARGSGTAGLAAPRPLQVMTGGRVHVRPLLTLSKKTLEQALRKAGAVWREDASNEKRDYLRNRIRHEVLPGWIAASRERDALAGVALSRELLEEDDDALEAWLDALGPLDRERRLDVKGLEGKPRAIVRRALYRWLALQKDTGDLSRQGFILLLAAVEQGKTTRFSLGRRGFAVIRKGLLFFEKAPRRGSIKPRK